MATAIIVDGAYFLRRAVRRFAETGDGRAAATAAHLRFIAYWHLAYRLTPNRMRDAIQREGFDPLESGDLYRVFFYDCPPLSKKMHRPISGKAVDLSKTDEAKLRLDTHEELLKLRKVALRLGRFDEASDWKLRREATKRLRSGDAHTLTDDDFEIDTKQKGVDMKLGLDVAAMAFKRQVDQIILIAGDADFVPAAKLARREGIDVVLDPMGGTPAADLRANVDGVRDHTKGEFR